MRHGLRRLPVVLAAVVVAQALPPSSAFAATPETTGGVTHTWTNYSNAGGNEGPTIPSNDTVQITCKVTGFKVADGNTWWYQIGSDPWNNNFYASADAFYNNGSTSGSLHGTPYVDPAVPDCGAAPPPPPPPAPAPSPNVSLAQGPAAPHGYRYAITLSNFAANTSVSVSCRDSVDAGGFYTFNLGMDGSGNGFTQAQCYSADGPDHWVVTNGSVESNHVSWSVSVPPAAAPPPVDAPPNPPAVTGPQPPAQQPPAAAPETCYSFSGVPAGKDQLLSTSLFNHYLEGTGLPVVVNWDFLTSDPYFVDFATHLPLQDYDSANLNLGHEYTASSGLEPDLYYALHNFRVWHTSVHCYAIYDYYDFDTKSKFFPVWGLTFLFASEFPVHGSGRL